MAEKRNGWKSYNFLSCEKENESKEQVIEILRAQHSKKKSFVKFYALVWTWSKFQSLCHIGEAQRERSKILRGNFAVSFAFVT